MSERFARLFGAVVIVSGIVFASGVAVERKGPVAPPDFAGRWRLNKELSDDEAARMASVAGGGPTGPAATAEGSSGRGGRRGGAGGRTAVPNAKVPEIDDDPRGALAAPRAADEMRVAQDEGALVVTDSNGRAHDYYPDGRTYKADDGASEVKSVWRDGVLVTEKKAGSGWKMEETWRLTPERRLRIDVRFAGGGRPTVVVKRIYDRLVEGR